MPHFTRGPEITQIIQNLTVKKKKFSSKKLPTQIKAEACSEPKIFYITDVALNDKNLKMNHLQAFEMLNCLSNLLKIRPRTPVFWSLILLAWCFKVSFKWWGPRQKLIVYHNNGYVSLSYFLYHDLTSLLDLAHHSLKNILMIFSHVFGFLTCYKSGESWKNIEIPINKEQHWQRHRQRSLLSALWTWHNLNTKPITIRRLTRIDCKSDPRPNSFERKSRVKMSTIAYGSLRPFPIPRQLGKLQVTSKNFNYRALPKWNPQTSLHRVKKREIYDNWKQKVLYVPRAGNRSYFQFLVLQHLIK